MASSQPIPVTRVISPSPTPTESSSARDSYFSSTTKNRNGRITTTAPIQESPESSDPESSRARPRSRSPQIHRKDSSKKSIKSPPEPIKTDGHLDPSSAGMGSSYWRNLSRSPSPLGLIPLHREWRTFIHRHEIPRKALHVSIGFFTLGLFISGAQTSAIHPPLLTALIPIFAIDFARMHYPPLNRLYIRLLGAFMRESEAHDKYNGVISYLAGAWAVLRFCPKDIAVMSILLLSWCDTAASTFGRLWGRYTPRVRKGKSLAGTIAAFITGVAAAVVFWVIIAPRVPAEWSTGINAFAYDGTLSLPPMARNLLGWKEAEATVSGSVATAIVAVVSGLVAAVSEAIDVFGLDDNLTIPVLSGIGLNAFFWAFGNGLP
ncbi:phosphatidate cytidylyltransferase, partial [Aureobasidium melanogenum]